mgnify:FL=1
MKNLVIIGIFSVIVLGQSRKGNIGICTQSIGDIKRKGDFRSGQIRKGESIYYGDKITTSSNAFISILILEDRSQIKLFENSIVKIFRNEREKTPKTAIAVFGGRLSAEINKKGNREFIVNTPSSIVSVIGTNFFVEHRPIGHSQLFQKGVADCVFSVITGSLKVENKTSGKLVYVNNGKTLISTSMGGFKLFETTKDFLIHFKEPN